MDPLFSTRKARNFLIGAGTYDLAAWMTVPLTVGLGKITDGIVYTGDFAAAVLMPIVAQLAKALVAIVAGAIVVWLVESDSPVVWLTPPIVLYAVLGFLGYHWARDPTLVDRVGQDVAAIFPAAACALGGIVASKRTKPLRND